MASAKPKRLPTFDSNGWRDRLNELLPKRADGNTITVWNQLPGFVTGLRGLRDTVNANAVYLDEVKGDLDEHRNVDNLRHAALASRVSALEAQGKPPFPASG